MPVLEIIEIIIGLAFVYLLLSLLCSAINEYVSALLNKRGQHLVRGIEQLLKDTGADDYSRTFFKHRLIKGLYNNSWWRKERAPSYIPARTFAMALLDVLGYRQGPGGTAVRAEGAAPGTAPLREKLADVVELLKSDAAADVTQFITDADAIAKSQLPDPLKTQLVAAVTGARSEYQKLHDSVEVWFNNAMDRVSGGYKRYTQIMLFAIGLGVAIASNADTIQIWRTLAADDALRTRLADQAARYAAEAHAAGDTAAADTMSADASTGNPAASGANPRNPAAAAGPAAQAVPDSPSSPETAPPARQTSGAPTNTPTDTAEDAQQEALEKYRKIRTQIDSMQLRLGWTHAEGMRLGLIRPDTVNKGTPEQTVKWVGASITKWKPGALFSKLIGLLLTTIALSMGAPFWFDVLNRFINIRGAGRAPDEKAKAPEAPGKRPAEQPTK